MRESLLQFQFSSLAENCGVQAKLIYKYQILYPWCHLVNDIDLCHSPKLPKTIKPPILAFTFIQGHWIRRQSRASVHFLLVINSNLGPISHRYSDTATYWPKIANFAHPLSFSTLVRGDPLRIYGKALRFLKLESFRQPTMKTWWF